MSIPESDWTRIWGNGSAGVFLLNQATKSYDLGSNAYPGKEGVKFVALTDMKITSTSAYMYFDLEAFEEYKATHPEAEYPTFSITVKVDNVLVSEASGDTDGPALYYEYYLPLMQPPEHEGDLPVPLDEIYVNAGQTVEIEVTGATGQRNGVWYGTAIDLQAFINGGLPNPTRCGDVIIDGYYSPFWTVDTENSGYPRLIEYDVTEFTEFETDGSYPKNAGAWKLDSNNDGYPWIVGFEKADLGDKVYLKTADGFTTAQLFERTLLGFNPLYVFTKTEEDDENADNTDVTDPE